MKNQKTKNIIIILLVLIIGFSVFFILKNSKKSENNEIKQEEQINQEENKAVIIDNPKDIPAGIIVPSTDLVQKFNSTMVLARASMLKSDYSSAINYYNQALTYQKDSSAYVGLYTVYLNQKNWNQALSSLDQAIKLSPAFGDYWNWKILVMDEGLHKSYVELKSVYNQGYPQIRKEEQINLITKFAVVSEKHGEKAEAIKLWQKAIQINPEKASIYQAEIDALNK